jgi:hypothetical protein
MTSIIILFIKERIIMPLKDSITIGISKIAKTVEDGAVTVAKKSGKMVEVSKLNLNISSEKDNIDRLYKKVGEIVYEKYKNGEIIDRDLEEDCKAIVEADENIGKLQKKITTIKGKNEEALDEEVVED